MRKQIFTAIVALLMLLILLLWRGTHTVRNEVLHSCSEKAALVKDATRYAALKKRWGTSQKSDKIIGRLRAIAPFESHRKQNGTELSFKALSARQLDQLMRLIGRSPLQIDKFDLLAEEHGKFSMKLEIGR
jgi:hypothetical protein